MPAAAEALVIAGTVVVVASALGALAARDAYHRLHFSAPITSLGGPLIAVGLSLRDGLGLTTASVLLPAGLLFLLGPPMTSAVARMLAQVDGRVEGEGPE